MLQNNFNQGGGPTPVPDHTQGTSVPDHTQGGSFSHKPISKPKSLFQKLGDRFKKAGQGSRLRTAKTDSYLGKAHSIKNILKREKASPGSRYKLKNLSEADIEWISERFNRVLKNQSNRGKGSFSWKKVRDINMDAFAAYKKGELSKADIEDIKHLSKSMMKEGRVRNFDRKKGQYEEKTQHILNTSSINMENSRAEDKNDGSKTPDFQTGYQFGNKGIEEKINNKVNESKNPNNVIDFEDYVKNKGEEQKEEEQKEEDEIKDMVI